MRKIGQRRMPHLLAHSTLIILSGPLKGAFRKVSNGTNNGVWLGAELVFPPCSPCLQTARRPPPQPLQLLQQSQRRGGNPRALLLPPLWRCRLRTC